MSADSELDPASVEELRRLARSRPSSGREAMAKASALRTLERLARKRAKLEPPSVPPGWRPPDDPFHEVDEEYLREHPEVVQRVWAQFWRSGRV